jgi:5-methylcytosine-specific restriction endonuclease McrA
LVAVTATGSTPPDLPKGERLAQILARDGAECVWCRRELTLGHRDLTLEHVIPRLKGGPAWLENEVAACRPCNRARRHTAPLTWLDACEQRGLRPNRAAITASLQRLKAAIEARGGQRKARPYLDAQLRRL